MLNFQWTCLIDVAFSCNSCTFHILHYYGFKKCYKIILLILSYNSCTFHILHCYSFKKCQKIILLISKKKTYLWKLLLAKMSCPFCPLGFLCWSIQISSCIYCIFQFLRIYKKILISTKDYGGVQSMNT